MKAVLVEIDGGKSSLVRLLPEDKKEEEILKDFAKKHMGPHMIHCRGFQYLSPEIDFQIQPMPSLD